MDRKKTVELMSAAALLVPILIYAFNIAPSLVGHDGDEYLLQAYQMGIAHPCGYPVYLWIGKVFLLLSNNALNTMNILSCVFSALTLILLYIVMRAMRISALPAAAAVLIFAFGPMFWEHALVSEVYNVNAFFLTGMLYLVYRFSRSHALSDLALAGVVYGVCLGIWFGNILLALPLGIFLLGDHRRRNAPVLKPLFAAVCAAAAGAVIPLVYIYHRSHSLPPLGTLYNPDTLHNFLLYITGKQYDTTAINGPRFLLHQGVLYGGLFAISFGVVGLIFAAKGVAGGWKDNRWYTVLLVSSFAVNFGYFTNLDVGDSYTMMTISYLVVAVLAGFGLEKFSAAGITTRRIAGYTALAIITAQVLIFPSIFPFKRDTRQFSRCRYVLEHLPADAILFAEWTDFTSLKCLQTLRKLRPDVRIYEAEETAQARNYIVDGRIKAIVWRDYIDKKISEGSRPVFAAYMDADLKEKYTVQIAAKGLFQLLPKERSL